MITLRRFVPTLIKISRPRFWAYTAGPFVLGYVAGLPRGYTDVYPPVFWIALIYFVLPANLFLYGINDLFDRDTDKLNAKKDDKEHRLAQSEDRVLIAVLIAACVLSAAMLLIIPSAYWWIFGAFILLSATYSAPPRFKARPILDSYSNVLYVLPGFLGYAMTANALPPLAMWIGGAAWAAGMHAYSAIPDIEPDSRAGVRTVAVALGAANTLRFILANWLAFAALMIGLLGLPAVITLLFPAIPIYFLSRHKNEADTIRAVDAAYWWFPLLNGFMGFVSFVWVAVINR
jgi:lycopene elongase/hydratase (dihydrobisanhydrobacterioruberin-forming)